MLVPIASLLFTAVPVATAHPPVYWGIGVICVSENYPGLNTYASVRLGGAYVIVSCTYPSAHPDSTCLPITGTTKYFVETKVGSQLLTYSGTIGPSSTPRMYIEGYSGDFALAVINYC